MNYEGKKLLVLAGAGPHSKVVEAAKEMGIYTIVADYLPASVHSPAKLIADENLMNNIFDVDELVEYGKENEIDGIIAFCIDPTQRPAQKIAEKLGLPAFGTWEQVLALTDKNVFKKLCKNAGVDIIPSYSEEDLKNDVIEYPVLVKPVDSRGSRGAKVCVNKNELTEALPLAKKESTDGGAIIEKYMGVHTDLTISYIVKDGQPTLISLGDRYPGRKEDNLDRQLSCTIQPSRYTRMFLDNVNDKIVDMIKLLGIQNGPVFFQGFEDGNTVRLYDPGLRFPGNEYERIFTKATGLNPMKSIISYCVGGENLDYDGKYEGSYDLNGKVAIQYMINVGAGTIARFDGLDEIAKQPYVLDIQQRHFVGEIIENTGDIKHRAGEISIMVDRDVDKMVEAIEFVQKTLRIEDVEGRNLIISPINAEMVREYYLEAYKGGGKL